MTPVRWLHEIDRTQVALVGGKAANLGELMRIDGIHVPAGFCVTTEATGLAAAVGDKLRELGEHAAYAVRSSATAEDSPTASFAGQHDSYLNVVGLAAILDCIERCRASLESERAVAYRRRAGIDHARMAVVVQRMVDADAAGVLFTADPISGHRKVSSIEAVAGLGEALVSGRAKADRYQVRDGNVTASGTTLTEAQAVRLAELGRRIEAHFGQPQDIEWCLAGEDFQFVQSRPITTLFPIPAASDGENHVYLSTAHQQMMTDPMTPLGLSVFQLTAGRPMNEAGGRLWVDVTLALASPERRAGLLAMAERSDPLVRDALQTIVDRDFVRSLPETGVPPAATPDPIEADPALVPALIARSQASLAALQTAIATKRGPALFDFILADLQELRRMLFDPESHRVVMAAIESTWWLNDHLQAWLGDRAAAETLALSVPHNVTSEMGLALMGVADVIRRDPDAVAILERASDDGFVAKLPAESRDALEAFLVRYGMRCAGEIDIATPRWSERPTTLVPALLANVRSFEPGAAERRFEQGRLEAEAKTREVLARLRALPDGEHKAAEMKRVIDRLRTYLGYREYPKYVMISRYFIYKQALLREAARLPLRDPEDIFYLTFQEAHEVARTHEIDTALIARRKDEYRANRTLTPPRVLTSEGEMLWGAYRREDLPAGALPGIAVSRGIVEGRARVVLDFAKAALEPGDILVTTFTDPSWTPAFVAIAGLVTEVGGLMSHGAVVAREYGLPAVVGVEHATRTIRDGQRIRVNATDGYVEIL